MPILELLFPSSVLFPYTRTRRLKDDHCVKSVQMRYFSWSGFSRIRTEFSSIRTCFKNYTESFYKKNLQDWFPLKTNILEPFWQAKGSIPIKICSITPFNKISYYIETSLIHLLCKTNDRFLLIQIFTERYFWTLANMLFIEIIWWYRNPVTCKMEILLWGQ